MQNRYIGDIHDFNKFIFLKFLSKSLKEQIGLNWYLNNPHNIGKKESELKDGQNRKYLNIEHFKKMDEEVFEEMFFLKDKKNRNLKTFTENSHLRKFINFFNKDLNLKNRKEWFSTSLKYFKPNNIVFLDPDNGLIPNKVPKKKEVKYILYEEIKKLYLEKKSIIFCQFQPYNIKHQVMLEIKIQEIYNKTKLRVNCPIIRNRSSPNTFFIAIIQNEYERKINKFIKNYAEVMENVDLVNL